MSGRSRINGYGVVKSVLSGDTVVLMGAPKTRGGMPPEKVVVFTGINAPRFARGRSGEDEPWAWEAREFIRKIAIGQQVSFSVNHSAGEREYGNVYVGEQCLAHSLLKAGLASVKEGKEGAKPTVEREQLMALEAEAKAAGVGMWKAGEDKGAHVRNVDWQPDANKLFDKFKGKPIPAVVSQLRHGSAIRFEVAGSVTGKTAGRPFMIVTMNLAGAQCPRVPFDTKNEDGERVAAAEAEPFALEAAHWVEARLLNREVQIVIQGIDKADNIFGDILFPKGDVTSKLLELGFANYVPWSACMSPNASNLEAAAKAAQLAKVRLGATAKDQAAPEELSGKVTFAQSGDTVVFANDADGSEAKFSLASIRAQRMPRRGETENKDSAYAFDAKEFLRTRLVGTKAPVRAVVEYRRTLPNGEQRMYGSLFVKEENISIAIVRQGLAEVVRHRMDDPHASCYGKLMEAERYAVNSKQGQWGNKGGTSVVDLTERPRRGEEGDDSKMIALAAKGATYLLGLKKEKNLQAVVEYCFSASRFKLYIPKEKILVSFVLSGVRSPNTKEPFGPEALEFSRSRCLQRSVRVEIETVDRGCNFIGNLFVGGTNLATLLLGEGLSSTYGPSADRSPYAEELYAAEAKAQEAKTNVWKNYVEKVRTGDAEVDESKVAKDGSSMEVRITEITDATSFFINRVDDESTTNVEAAMEVFNANPPAATDAEIVKGKVYGGLYSDGAWYRVRVEGKTASGEWRVQFVDFGNSDLLEGSNLRELPENVSSIPNCAKACFLAGVRAPTKTSEHFELAAQTFHELAFDRVLNAKVHCVDKQGKMHLTLTPKKEDVEEGTDDAETPINTILLREGMVRLMERPEFKLKPYVASLKDIEDAAKLARYNIWEYGDVSDEEEEDEESKKKVKFDGRTGKPRS